MCGIAGWFGGSVMGEAAEVRLARMCDTILHRGPDNRGMFHRPGIGLAMQRLSIVDLSGGHQPMSSNDGLVQIVLNGEIYNHNRLRDELRAKQISFKTRSDTEVVLRLYEAEGLSGFEKLNGMFAFAIWDGHQNALHLVRDRMGVKPLYWRYVNGELLFASEIKAIVTASDRESLAINERAIWDYLTFRYVPGPQTIWRSIQSLPAGHRLTIGKGASEPSLIRYWDIPRPCTEKGRNASDLQAEFDALFADAVDLRMLADVPVGVLLSGGLDSSAVAVAAHEGGHRLNTYSVAFDGSPATDELPYARAVAGHLGCDHHEVVIGQKEFMDFLPQMQHLTDQPLADLASVPLYYVCKRARQDVKVVVSGEGSDEILGGYSFDRWVDRWRNQKGRNASWVNRLRRLMPRGGGAEDFSLDLRQSSYPLVMTNYLTSEEKRRLLANPGNWPDSLDGPRAQLKRFGPGDPLEQALYTYCQDWLVEDLLMKADRMSMGTSVELRTPFLDYRLVEFAACLPADLRVGPDASGALRTKLILRNYAKSRLPAEIIERPKQGFPVPVYDWLSNALKDWAYDCLLSHDARISSWCGRSVLSEYVMSGTAEHATNDSRHRLWNLLILELWMRQWL